MSRKYRQKKAKRKLFVESLFVFFIAISPFLYKLYDYLPDDPDATISFLGITIGNNGFQDVSTFMWFMMSKIVPLYLLIFWFLTSRDWWYHIILIPIGMYAFQVFEVVVDSDDNIDTENLLWLLPVCMFIIPFVYFIRVKLVDKYVHGIDLEAMEAELKDLKRKQESTSEQDFTAVTDEAPLQEDTTPASFSDTLDEKFSTDNIEAFFKKAQNYVKSLLHFK